LKYAACRYGTNGTCGFTNGKVCVMSGGYNYDGWQINGKGG